MSLIRFSKTTGNKIQENTMDHPRLIQALLLTSAIVLALSAVYVSAGGKGKGGEDIILYNNNILIRGNEGKGKGKGKGGETIIVAHGNHEHVEPYHDFGYGFGHHEYGGLEHGEHEHHEMDHQHYEHKKQPVVVVEVKGKMKSKGKGGMNGGKGKGKGKGGNEIDYEKLLMGGHSHHK